MTLIKSISGIRGTIGGSTTENLTPIDIAKFASAYATWLKEQSDCSKRHKVVIGRDARISGEMVSTIVEGTLLGCGIDVINIGLASTPTTEMAVTAHSADGGIIVTASHNPKQWNALKLLNSKGEFLSDADGKRILAIADSDSYIFPEVDSLGKVLEHSSYNQQHIEQVLALKLV
ncbi:MAG: phosphoglucosamine mutase, partial [Rikenellaceae bacterium]|nr:phosphoglucosamine mutase [Rikenellaceae bacterium]